MNRRFSLAAALAVAGSSLLFLAPSADAVGAPTSAWWARVATTTPTDEVPAALPVPAPTTPDTVPVGATVPEGNLLVEGAPDGATAIAAARWELSEGESSPSLTLPVGEGSTLNPESVVLACRTATPWTEPEAEPGMWDNKPLVDGARCINGIVAEDLSTVTFGLQPLVSGSTLDVVLVPGKDPSAQPPDGVPDVPADVDGSVFRWMFEAPSADSVEVVAASDFSAGEGDRFIEPTPSPTPHLGAVDTPALESPAPVDPTQTSPAFEGPEETTGPALPDEDLAGSPTEVRDLVPAATAGAVNRTIAWVLLALSALMAAWAHLTSDAGATSIGLGRFRTALPATATGARAGAGAGVEGAGAGEGVVGGLSRFSRPRRSPPTPLS